MVGRHKHNRGYGLAEAGRIVVPFHLPIIEDLLLLKEPLKVVYT
jgi:hypothetical protein